MYTLAQMDTQVVIYLVKTAKRNFFMERKNFFRSQKSKNYIFFDHFRLWKAIFKKLKTFIKNRPRYDFCNTYEIFKKNFFFLKNQKWQFLPSFTKISSKKGKNRAIVIFKRLYKKNKAFKKKSAPLTIGSFALL